MNAMTLKRVKGGPLIHPRGSQRHLQIAQATKGGERVESPRRSPFGEQGSALVELALSCSIVCGMLFGLILMCYALYAYDFVSEAAREGTRWAIVRGSTSCTNTPNLTNCNAATSDITNYVEGLGYPGIDSTDKMTVTTTYWTPSGAACTTGTCNAPLNFVQVEVTYAFPLNIPFLPSSTLNIHSTSRMAIAQ
jgi:Flp pilus assembly protein TadG